LKRNMKIAIIGYGRMGHEIEGIAIRRGHTINLVIDKDNAGDLNAHNLKGIDVAIEFSFPETAFRNILTCLELKVPVVSGTTGWLADYEKAAEACRLNNTSFIHSSNFSLGVNILFRLNSELAGIMSGYHEYSPSIEEIHHIKKLDAPSGTAISLAGGIIGQNVNYTGWSQGKYKTGNKIPINSIREGTVPGIHTVEWESDDDIISLRHETRSRKGLASGALLAAEYISVRKGIFTMGDVLGF
jgi:4-hydroxy-tetrahydrodipicolinate reductase